MTTLDLNALVDTDTRREMSAFEHIVNALNAVFDLTDEECPLLMDALRRDGSGNAALIAALRLEYNEPPKHLKDPAHKRIIARQLRAALIQMGAHQFWIELLPASVRPEVEGFKYLLTATDTDTSPWGTVAFRYRPQFTRRPNPAGHHRPSPR